jgi:uncharacterized protein (TIRG00374 family)
MTAVRRRWLRVVALVAFATLLVAFGRTVDWRAAAAAAKGADIGLLLLALVANQLSLALKAVRWWVFLRPLGVRSLWLVVRATFAGASLNNLVVAQGGEGARVLLVSRATGVSSARVAAALALERVLDAVSYLTLLVTAAWMMDLPEMLLRWRTAASVALGIVVVLLVALSRRSEEQVPRPGLGTTSRLRSYAQRFTSSASDLATPARLIIALVLSLGAWALQVATYHTVARAAHLPISLSGSTAALLAIGISFLLRATPGNVGVFQLIYAVTARGFGIAEGPAVAAALLIQTIQVIPTVTIGTVMAHGLLARDREEELLSQLSATGRTAQHARPGRQHNHSPDS